MIVIKKYFDSVKVVNSQTKEESCAIANVTIVRIFGVKIIHQIDCIRHGK